MNKPLSHASPDISMLPECSPISQEIIKNELHTARIQEWGPPDSWVSLEAKEEEEASSNNNPLLHATQRSFSHVLTTSMKSKAQPTQNVQSHAAGMSDAAARGSRGL